MIVAELIKELEQLDQNERIIVSVKQHVETLFTTFDVYHKGDIRDYLSYGRLWKQCLCIGSGR